MSLRITSVDRDHDSEWIVLKFQGPGIDPEPYDPDLDPDVELDLEPDLKKDQAPEIDSDLFPEPTNTYTYVKNPEYVRPFKYSKYGPSDHLDLHIPLDEYTMIKIIGTVLDKPIDITDGVITVREKLTSLYGLAFTADFLNHVYSVYINTVPRPNSVADILHSLLPVEDVDVYKMYIYKCDYCDDYSHHECAYVCSCGKQSCGEDTNRGYRECSGDLCCVCNRWMCYDCMMSYKGPREPDFVCNRGAARPH